jgi:tRNA pseudouridine55 synthase
MDGILNINKPDGKTSFSIVAMVKKLSGASRVGHAGTLDPSATGVLPVCLGQGTRVIEFLMETSKTYLAQVELGKATDTYDATGKTTQQGDYSGISLKRLKSALSSFRGSIQQVPPMYSAVKHHGQPLYELARAGIDVERKSRPAEIYRLELIDWQPPVAIVEVECSKGTYIRSLANDLGQALGCGANLKKLIRLKYGPFDVKNALTSHQLEHAFQFGYWQHFLYPIDTILLHWPAILVDDDTFQAISNGQPVAFKEFSNNRKTASPNRSISTQPPNKEKCRAYTAAGRFLGILHYDPVKEQWQPDKVFLSRV